MILLKVSIEITLDEKIDTTYNSLIQRIIASK